MKDTMRLLAIGVVSSLLTAVAMFSVPVLADGLSSTDDVAKLVPYRGTLEKDGLAINGTVTATFGLYYTSSTVLPAWTETLSVVVAAGEFEAILGSSSAASSATLSEVLNKGDDLYLGITIDDGSGDVSMVGRQRFYPAPFAIWATASTDLVVGGGVTVDSASAAVVVGTSLGSVTFDGQGITATPGDLALNEATGNAIEIEGDLEFDSSVYTTVNEGRIWSADPVLSINPDALFSNVSINAQSTLFDSLEQTGGTTAVSNDYFVTVDPGTGFYSLEQHFTVTDATSSESVSAAEWRIGYDIKKCGGGASSCTCDTGKVVVSMMGNCGNGAWRSVTLSNSNRTATVECPSGNGAVWVVCARLGL